MAADLSQTKEWLRHLPNKLTLARIAAIPLLLLLYPLTEKLWPLCGVIFALAAITDLLDGWLARKYGNVTPLGALLDPIADKMLVTAALVLLASSDVIPAFLAALLICREIAINGVRLLALEQSFKIEVSDLGKWKTTLQSVAIFCLMVYEPVFRLPFREVGMVTLWAALLLSLYSAWLYGKAYLQKAKVTLYP